MQGSDPSQHSQYRCRLQPRSIVHLVQSGGLLKIVPITLLTGFVNVDCATVCQEGEEGGAAKGVPEFRQRKARLVSELEEDVIGV